MFTLPFLICIVTTLKTPSLSAVHAHLPISAISSAPPRPFVAALSVGRHQSSHLTAITPGHMTSVTIRQCLTALGVLIYLISNQLACYNWMQLPFTERERRAAGGGNKSRLSGPLPPLSSSSHECLTELQGQR